MHHGILCKNCYHEKHKEYKRNFFCFLSALDIEFDTSFKEQTKTLEDTAQIMHDYWETFVLESKVDPNGFAKCYKKGISFVKKVYETLESQ